jgi:hypothetical protein
VLRCFEHGDEASGYVKDGIMSASISSLLCGDTAPDVRDCDC